MRVIGLVKLMEEKEKASLKDEGIACLWEYVEILQNELRGARKKPIKVFLILKIQVIYLCHRF